LFSHVWLFSLGTMVSSTNKTDRHHIHVTEILWKVALNTITAEPSIHTLLYLLGLFITTIELGAVSLEF
jgi:hypothetical protein